MLAMGLISGGYCTKTSTANLTTKENNLKNKKIDKNKEVGVAPLSLIEGEQLVIEAKTYA